MKAFPTTQSWDIYNGKDLSGMDLRDYFAAKALPELMARSGGYWSDEKLLQYAVLAYKQADAMMEARK